MCRRDLSLLLIYAKKGQGGFGEDRAFRDL